MRALLLVVGNEDHGRVSEFALLSDSGGYDVVDVIVQRRPIDSRFYVGPGKFEEIRRRVRSGDIDAIITYHPLKPIQYMNLSSLGVKVLDRVQLILEIFDKRAGSREARLQIELARLRHELPRVREIIRLSKLGEQAGLKASGEYAIEAQYRHMLARISRIRRELEEIRRRKEETLSRRRYIGLPEVALVGYTMSGKTTLFNRLSKESKYSDGKPFATLNTYSRLVDFGGAKALLTDTIGFIDDLPPLLIESFYATVAEVINADLLLLVTDLSDDLGEFRRKLRSSLEIFEDLGVSRGKVLPVLNKVDLAVNTEEKVSMIKEEFGDYVVISAARGYGIGELRVKVREKLGYVTVKVPLSIEEIPQWVYRYGKVHVNEEGTYITLHESLVERIMRDIS